MFQDSLCELVTRTVKSNDGISIELHYYIQLSSEERAKLKEYRENYAKSSPLHFNFEEDKFLFSQKKYFKKSQFVEKPPKLEKLESKFLDEIKITLKQYKNFLQFDQIENLEKNREINLKDLLLDV